MRRTTTLFLALLGLFAAFLLPRSAAAQTVIAGGNVVNQTWTAANSPYIIQGDIKIPATASLTIQAGTVVQFTSSDGQASGLDTGRVELVVEGTLTVSGSVANPVTFSSQVGTTAGSWYGIVIENDATSASITGAVVRHAFYGVRSAAPAGALSVTDSTFQTNSYGVYLEAGSPALTRVGAISNSAHGFYAGGTSGPTLTDCIARNNGNQGVLVYSSLSSNTNTTLSGCTLHANSGSGLYVQADTGSSATVSIENANVTQNLDYGIYRYPSGGSATVSATYSNVWQNTDGNLTNVVGGVGMFAANPLYVAAPTNLRLTSNSPSRFAADDGGDLGPLPYDDDDTNGLHGTLWTNRTLNAAGSPYAIVGDLTIAPGVTLTIDPGVTLQFGTSDVMIAYDDTGRSELRVFGTLSAVGTFAMPITFTSSGSAAGSWYGVVLHPTASGSTLDRVVINEAFYGIRHRSTGSHTLRRLDLHTSSYGFYADDGAIALQQVTARSNSAHGIYFGGPSSGSVTNSVSRNNGNQGILIYTSLSSSSQVLVQSSTLHANSGSGVYVQADTGSSATLTVRNSIVTQNLDYGIYRYPSGGTATASVSYSNVWQNTDGNLTNLTGGTGMLSANPQYAAAPTDLHLQSTSVSIDTGTATGAPGIDRDDVSRPIDGDGLNGAEHDMGAYEYLVAGFCGDGVQQAGEACDDGGDNGDYGYCLVDCTGMGPFCGDGDPDAGDEECDDGNGSNTDACLNDCTMAACGDGFVRQGTEQCDDGNMANTDACLNTCMPATCGDSFVRQGMEQCDDGNDTQTDACLEDCTSATCGDSFVQTGVEDCDDGNDDDDDLCANDCTLASCGDGVTQSPEECDDGNASNTDACLNTCQSADCGDGFVQANAEACDDGNQIDSDSCSNACVGSACGDGVQQSGEPCDDGNASNTDACLEECKLAACGDGHVHVGEEECDDANGVSGDGCAPDCTLESAGEGGGGQGGQGEGAGNGAGGNGEGAGSSGEGGAGNPSGGDDDGDGDGTSGDAESGGCGCRTAGTAPAQRGGVVALLGIALLVARRRRRAA